MPVRVYIQLKLCVVFILVRGYIEEITCTRERERIQGRSI
jgi:hypothetical protein